MQKVNKNKQQNQLNPSNSHKEIRKIMNSIFKMINAMKANPFYETKETVKEEIINCSINPCELIDEDQNSRINK